MAFAISLARAASFLDEIPVGAIVVKENKIIGSGFNRKEKNNDPCSHAEILAIQNACQNLKNWRLNDCHLYVTMEPCLMCAGAILQSRIQKVIYGVKDPKGGALGSLYSLHDDKRLNHRFEIESGVLAEESQRVIKDFFTKLRTN